MKESTSLCLSVSVSDNSTVIFAFYSTLNISTSDEVHLWLLS